MLKRAVFVGLFFMSFCLMANSTTLSREETEDIIQFLEDKLNWAYNGKNIELWYTSPGSKGILFIKAENIDITENMRENRVLGGGNVVDLFYNLESKKVIRMMRYQ